MRASPAWDPLANLARKQELQSLPSDELQRASSCIKAFHADEPAWQGSFPTVSGGVLSISQPAGAPLHLVIADSSNTGTECGCCLRLDVHSAVCELSLVSADGSMSQLAHCPTPCSGNGCSSRITHWLSLDVKGNVKYGQGYAMQETMQMAASMHRDACAWMHQPSRRHVSLAAGGSAARPTSCCTYQARLQERLGPQAPTVSFSACPLGPCNPPPLVCDAANASLMDLDWSSCLPSCDLPAPCRELYAVLSHPRIDLDCPRALEGSLCDAIAWSLCTPGALLHRTIQSKKGRCFGGASPGQCYIRISVGHAHGTSPGDPLVMEIWPPGHSSPIHSHANTFGVVRVLHGTITVGVHNKHARHGDAPLAELDVKRGQVTWFSPQWYQTHALENRGSIFCCTVQGFRYAPDDAVCWPYMDYAGADGEHHDFDPVSDFTFAQLRSLVLAEYAERGSQPSSAPSSPSKLARLVQPRQPREQSPQSPTWKPGRATHAGFGGCTAPAALQVGRESAEPAQPMLDLLRVGARPLERLSPSAKGFLARR